MKLRSLFLTLICIPILWALGSTPAMAAEGYLTYDEAVLAVRQGLLQRQSVVTVQVQSETELFSADCSTLYDLATAHTGVPTEGDYLRHNTGGCSYDMEETIADGMYYYSFSYTPVWLATLEQEAEVDAAVAEILNGLNLWEADEYEKICGVYDWITENVQYDFDNLDDNAYTLKHSTYSAVVQRETVCQGYATLLYRMLLTLGVDCRYISGNAGGESHAWNIVKLDGAYYNCDPTWDRDLKGHYRYFLCTDAGFATHSRSSRYDSSSFRAQYPVSQTPYIRNVAASGTVNGSIAWVLDGDTGTLTITGSGPIPSYRFSEPPWYPHRASVQHIVVEEGITEIGERALYWCTNCTSVDLPDSLTAIREYGCNNLRSLTSITLPPNLKTLEFCAFSECAALRSIELPDSVTNVGTSVFSNCPALTSAKLSAGMTTIPSSMFFNDKKLSSITIPEGITFIDDTAFHSTGMKQVTLPASLTGMGSSVFAGCTSLKSFTVAEGNPVYQSIGGVLFSADGKTLLTYPAGKNGSYAIPEGTVYIADSAFRSARHMGSITFPASLREIGGYAFSYCSALFDVTFPATLTKIGEDAFRSCTSLSQVRFLNDSVELGSGVFAECDSLWEITLPAKLKAVPGYLFFGCGMLTEVTIPDTAVSIGSSAFLDCDYLTDITIPGNVRSIGRQAFDYCNRLQTITLEEGVQRLENICIRNAPALTAVYLPDSVTYIDSDCFGDCPQLTLYGNCGTYGQRYANSRGIPYDASHPYTQIVTFAPTCTAQGYTRTHCSCGSYWQNSQYTAALGHSFHMGSCTVCGATDPDYVAPTPVVTATPTPTPVVTPTPTATPTPTPVVTPTPTATPTPTPVVTPKPTATPTPTPVVTPTPTATPTPTPVVTPMPTATPTPTPVVTPKPTATPTPTPVVTPKPTATPTPTPVVTPMPTATPTPTPVVTPKPTATPTPTPVVTPKPTATPTPTPVVTPTPTATPTPTPVVTPKPTATPTPTPVVTPKPTATPTPTPVVTPKPTATPTPTPVVTPKPTATPTPTPVVTPKPTATPTPTPVVTPMPTATPTPTPVVTPKPTATPTPTPVVTPKPTPTPPIKNPFTDVHAQDYFHTPVLWAVQSGITAGTSPTTFGPNDPCTRGQVVTFLWAAAGRPAPAGSTNPFTDVRETDYYYNAVLWAVEQGITAGTSPNTFGPSAPCTRAHVATFLWRSVGSPATEGADSPFTDVASDAYYRLPVLWAVANEVTSGIGQGLFGPDAPCTRAQIVTFLYKTYC